MRSAPRHSIRFGAVLFAFLMLLADVSGGLLTHPVQAAPASDHEPPILVEGLPPLMCGDELCERPTDAGAGRPSLG